MFKKNETPDPLNQEFVDLTRFSAFLEGKKVDIEKLQAIRAVYGHFISKMSTTPTAMKKYNENYNTANYRLDWENLLAILPNNVRHYIKRISTQDTS